MPKQLLKINKFEGGVNTSSSERTVLEGQSPLATNTDTTSLGTLRTLGNAKSNNIAFYDPGGVADPGYGLFTFSHDYDMINSASGALKASPAANPTSYLCKATTTGIAIYDYTNKVWYDSGGSLGVTDIISFDDSGGDILPVFYIVDGAIRVCDALHAYDQVKWLGFINRNLWSTSGQPYAHTLWHSGNANIWDDNSFSTAVELKETSDGVGWPVDASGNVDHRFNLYYAWDETDAELSTFATGRNYNIYMSALYDDIKQEGALIEIGSMGAPGVNPAKLKFGLAVRPGTLADPPDFSGPNARMRGLRVYIQDSLDAWGQVYQMLEVDFVRGVKKSGSPAFDKPWHYDATTYSYWSESGLGFDACFVFEDMPVGNTYDAQNGHYPSEETKAGFTCATVIGRNVYIGGITEQEGTDFTVSSGRKSGDAMLKSPANAFDKFPTLNKVEAVTSDGDEIIALENFGGKLLQFKKESLYVIAVSGDIEVLEAQYRYVGITKPYHVVSTSMGLFWINKLGLHWYSQEGKISNLIENKLSLKTWDFSDNSSIGFDALNKKLVIAKDVRTDSETTGYKSKDVIVFDMRNMGFMFGIDTIDGGAKTNFTNAPDGKLIYAVDGTDIGYGKIDLSANTITYNFYGTLAKYNTSYGSSKWEYETYPWNLIGGTPGTKGMDPLGALERNIVVWDDTKHTIAGSADVWKSYSGSAIALTTVFDKGERFDIVDSIITTPNVHPSGMNRTWMRNNATNVGENSYILNISPVGMIEEGSQMNAMRGYAEEILTYNNGGSALTWDDIIDGSTGGPYTKAIDRGDATTVTWTLTIDTWGDGDIDAVAFHLSVQEPFASANFRLIGGSLMEWSDQPADTADFTYYTKDIDFGSPAQDKRVSKVYVTFKSLSSKDAADDLAISKPSNVLVRMHYRTKDGEYTVDFDASNSKNYDATTGLTAEVDTGDWTTATLKPKKTDINTTPKAVPSKILSAQLVLYTSEGKKTPGGFEVGDITISYRMGTIK